MIGGMILFIAVCAPVALIAWKMQPEKKRGCGRGCATCANREICHDHKFEAPRESVGTGADTE